MDMKPWSRWRLTGIFLVGAVSLVPPVVFAAATGEVDCGECNAPEEDCVRTYGTDACGNPCSRGISNNACSAERPACGETTVGTRRCGGACTRTGGQCQTESNTGGRWVPYGYAVPGEAVYGFHGQLPNLDTPSFVGLAAKGNIIIGNYTDHPNSESDFPGVVAPLLQPKTATNPDGKTQPYLIDPSDEALGYWTGSGGVWEDRGRPLFNSNYTATDGGHKVRGDGQPATDGNGQPLPRRFYESSFHDEAFLAVLDKNRDGVINSDDDKLFKPNATATIDAVLYTNHALAGIAMGNLIINGALVSRDDGLVVGKDLTINHDTRLIHGASAAMALPYTIARPRLVSWVECPPSGCP